jgi:hypothetical protein
VTSAQFNGHQTVAVDVLCNICIYRNNHFVRMATKSADIVSTIAGNRVVCSSQPAETANKKLQQSLNFPQVVAVDVSGG